MLNTPIAPPRVAFIDPRTGAVSREWYMFFLSLYQLSGEFEDLKKGPPAAETDALIAAATQNTAPSQDATLEQIVELRKQLDALAIQVQPELGSLSAVNIDWVPYLGFDTAPPWIGTTAGQFWFDSTTGSFNAKMGNNNITQQVGEEFFRYGKASATISDTNLQLVYKTGVVGASGVITFAPAVAGLTDPDQILGVATEPITINTFGRITTMGVVRGINTTGSVYGEVWADNDDIWYNPVTGGLTKTKPSAPNMKLMVGTVINAGGGGSGSFSVKLGTTSTLGGTDSNVQLGTLANGHLLVYDNSLGYWRNAPITAGTGITVTNGPGSVKIDASVAALTAGANISITGTTTKTISVTGLGSMAFESTGVSGTFTTADTPPKTVTVTNGIITSIV